MKGPALAFYFLFCFAVSGFSQKQLVIMKNGQVRASFKEGEYLRFVLKKGHRRAEGHIVELSDFSMITSNDTVNYKEILKINIKKHRGEASWGRRIGGGLLFFGSILYTAIDQANVAYGVNAQNNTPGQWITPLALSGVGAALLFIRPRYARINGIQYLKMVEYTSPFYQR